MPASNSVQKIFQQSFSGPEILIPKGKVFRRKVFAPNYDLGFYQRLFVGPLLNLKADDVDKKVYSLLYAD